MKNLLVLLFGFTIIFAQTNNDVSEQLKKIFELSKNKEYKTASNHIAYTGENSERKYSSTLNPKSADELDEAERMIKKIKAYIDISDSYEFSGSTTETTNDVELTTIVVTFKSGKQELEIPFKFFNNGGKYLLVSID